MKTRCLKGTGRTLCASNNCGPWSRVCRWNQTAKHHLMSTPVRWRIVYHTDFVIRDNLSFPSGTTTHVCLEILCGSGGWSVSSFSHLKRDQQGQCSKDIIIRASQEHSQIVRCETDWLSKGRAGTVKNVVTVEAVEGGDDWERREQVGRRAGGWVDWFGRDPCCYPSVTTPACGNPLFGFVYIQWPTNCPI